MSDTFGAERLKTIIERIERLNDEMSVIRGDIKEVYSEAKGSGYDTKAIRKLVALRRKPAHERAEEEAILETYLNALGMLHSETQVSNV
jgi:uncharacterized protein (UPF0335 family)